MSQLCEFRGGTTPQMGPRYSLGASIGACRLCGAHINGISHRPDEISYVWQVNNRWTVATALFGFVRESNPLKDEFLHRCGTESIYKPTGLHHPVHPIPASEARSANVRSQ